jgi:hypothetical protein
MAMRMGRIPLLLILCCMTALLWLACAKLAVPPLIESVYRGESLPVLNPLIQGQSQYPVSHYLQVWDKITMDVIIGLLGFWLVVMVKTSPSYFRQFVGEATPGILGAMLLLLLNVLFVYPVFMPTLSDIGMFDEAGYIESGRQLIQGQWTPYGQSPLASFLYALTYLPVQASPYWLIHSCAIGRFILFLLLWLSAYLVAKQLSRISPPQLMIGLLLVSPVLSSLVRNGSHALFAAMSAFAFYQCLRFYYTANLNHLLMASIFVGLATLSRSGEGLILFFTLTVASVLLGRASKRVRDLLAICVVPFSITVGTYMTLYFLSTGELNLGMADYSYTTFEQGHGLAFRGYYDQHEAHQVFGTQEENHSSVVNAILRNPTAYLQRIPRLGVLLPSSAVDVYGGGISILFFLMAARGAIEIVRKKYYTLCLLFIFWPIYSVLYVLLVFQPTHLLSPYYVVFFLTGVGLTSVVSSFASTKERLLWSATLVGLAILGLAKNQPIGFVAAELIFFLGLWIIWLTIERYPTGEIIKPVGVVMGLVLLLISGSYYYHSPKFRTLGIAPNERAAVFMRDHLQPSAHVGTYAPRNVWVSKMTYVRMHENALGYMNSDQEFLHWMTDNNLAAIYVDSNLKHNKTLWALIERQIGKSFQVGFEDGDVQVLLKMHGAER